MLQKLPTKPKKTYGLSLVLLILMTFVLILIINLSNLLIEWRYNVFFKNQTTQVIKSLEQEQKSFELLSEEFSTMPELAEALAKKDLKKIEELLQDKISKEDNSLLMISDEKGTVLSRKKLKNTSGDNVFFSTRWGHILYQNNSVSIISASTHLPLIMIAGKKISHNNKEVGAIFVGKALDDNYAKYFKKKYLSNNTQILFYHKNEGVVGSSFNANFIQNTLKLPLSTSADWIKNNADSIPEYLNINGNTFYAKNLKLNQNQNDIGALIFIPHYNYIISIILGAIFAFIAILFYYRQKTKKWFKFKKKKRTKYCLLNIISYILIFIFAALLNNYFISRGYKKIQAPNYTIYNSTLKLNPDFGKWSQSFPHTVSIVLTPGEEKINTMAAEIKYNPQLIDVSKINLSQSVCDQNMIIDKRIDKNKGLINLACIIDAKKIIDVNYLNLNIADIEIIAKKEEEFELNFTENTQVLASDGLGTNVLRQSTGGYYMVYDDKINSADALFIYSPTHPNSNIWYSEKEIELMLSNNEQTHYYSLDKNKQATASQLISNNNKSANFKIKDDGIYYFHIADDLRKQQGHFTNYRIKIDSIGPHIYDVKVSSNEIKPGETVRLIFESKDDLSGVQSNYLKINDNIFLPVNQQIFLPLTQEGPNNLTIRSFDNANNYTDYQITINVLAKTLWQKINNIDLSSILNP